MNIISSQVSIQSGVYMLVGSRELASSTQLSVQQNKVKDIAQRMTLALEEEFKGPRLCSGLNY